MSAATFWLFLFLLIFSPLAFGTVEPWSLAVMKSLAFLTFILVLLEKKRDKEPFLYEIPGLVPLVLFLGYTLLQLVPLPPGVIRLVSPATYGLYRDTLWVADPGAWGSISLHKKATVSAFFTVAACAACYVVSINVMAKKDMMKKAIAVVVLFISVLALFSMFQHALWNGKIYWLRELTAGGKPFGPYVNRNHYAGLADMVLPLVVCLFIYYRPRYSCRPLRHRIVEIFSNPLTHVHVLLGFAALLVALSVFLSLSKGGIISLCMSMVFLAAVVRNREKAWVLIALTVTLVCYSVGWFGWERIFERFDALRDAQGGITEVRLGIWKDTLTLIRDFPLTGTGLGSYVHVYPRYRSGPAGAIVDHAHNDYLELLSECGLVGAVIFACFLAAVARTSFRSFLMRRGHYSVMLYAGAVSGIVSMLVFSITDFNLHIGANALYFFFLAGLAVSTAHTSMRGGRTDTYLDRTGPVTNRMVIPSVAVLLLSLAFDGGGLLARSGLPSLRGERLDASTRKERLEEVRASAQRASILDPLSASPHYAAATAEWLLSYRERAVEDYKKAVRRDPVNGGFLQALGLALSALGRDETADALLLSGIRCDSGNPLRHKTYASWLISSGRKEEGAEHMRKAISLEPEKTRGYVALLVLYGWTDEEIGRALPDMIRPRILFAEYLHHTGNDGMAVSEFRAAAEYGRAEEKVAPSDFHKAGRYFMKRGQFNDALTVMRMAEEALPTDVETKMILGEIYEEAGIPYRAAEEYRKVLIIDPREHNAKRKLAKMQQAE